MKFYASVRLDIRPIGSIKKGEYLREHRELEIEAKIRARIGVAIADAAGAWRERGR